MRAALRAMTERISTQVAHVIRQLLPLIERMRSIDWALTPPELNSDVASLRALVTAANHKLRRVPMADAGRETAQRITDALLEGVARWSKGDRADAAVLRAEALHDDAVRLLQGA
jgi:hypothetical protein